MRGRLAEGSVGRKRPPLTGPGVRVMLGMMAGNRGSFRLFLAIALSAGGIAQALPAARWGGSWLFPKAAVRRGQGDGYSVTTPDPMSASRAIAAWMSEHGGRPEDPDHPGIELRSARWIVPREELRAFERFLAGLGSPGILSVPSRPPGGSPDPFGELRSKRDELIAERERMSGRLPVLPAVDRLIMAYVKSASTLLSGAEGAEREALVSVTLLGGAAQPLGVVPPAPAASAAGSPMSDEEWDAVRYPVTSAARDDEAYLSWPAKFPPILELEAEDIISVRISDLDRSRDELGALMRSLGARRASFGPPSRRETIQVGGIDYIAESPVGYWIPRDRSEEFRRRMTGFGETVRWEETGERSRDIPDDSVEWQRALKSEIDGEDDHLAPYPAVRALVMDQIRRLSLVNETRTAGAARLTSVRLMRRL